MDASYVEEVLTRYMSYEKELLKKIDDGSLDIVKDLSDFEKDKLKKIPESRLELLKDLYSELIG